MFDPAQSLCKSLTRRDRFFSATAISRNIKPRSLARSVSRSLSWHGAVAVGGLAAVVELLEQEQDLRLADSELLHPDYVSSH